MRSQTGQYFRFFFRCSFSYLLVKLVPSLAFIFPGNMAAKEDVSKPFGEDAGEILQLYDESNDEGHGEGTYEFDVDEMKSQLGIDDIVKSVAALTELVKRKVDNSADTEVGLKRAKLVAGSSFSNSSPPEGSEPSTSAVAKSFTTDTETRGAWVHLAVYL